MPYCRCGTEFSEARARLGFDCCLECGTKEAAAEITRRARMIAPISHKPGYTYLGSDKATQRQRLLEGSAKTPRMETGARVIGHAARPRQKSTGATNSWARGSSPISGGYAKASDTSRTTQRVRFQSKAQPARHRSSSLDGLFGN